eukprot:1445419-Prymnesium_polylepis.1
MGSPRGGSQGSALPLPCQEGDWQRANGGRGAGAHSGQLRSRAPADGDVSVTVVLVPGVAAAPQLLSTVLGWQQAHLWIICSVCCSFATRRWSSWLLLCEGSLGVVCCGCGVCCTRRKCFFAPVRSVARSIRL